MINNILDDDGSEPGRSACPRMATPPSCAAPFRGFAGAQVSTCARIRHIGDMGLTTKGDFPGTSAWRPPTC